MEGKQIAAARRRDRGKEEDEKARAAARAFMGKQKEHRKWEMNPTVSL
jgi:hypothetical protein